jgi:probable HAF family extracellular repeat protein
MAQGSCPCQSSVCELDSISGPLDVETLGGTFSIPIALNAHGQVVGTSQTSDLAARAYSWTQANGIQPLTTLPGARNSAAGSVNLSGQIVGSSEDSQRVSHAVLWTQAGAMPQDLGTLSAQGAAAGPVSDGGQVVISRQDSSQAFLWTIGSTLPGIPVPPLCPSSPTSKPTALNPGGLVIGQSATCNLSSNLRPIIHGFSWILGPPHPLSDLLSIGNGAALLTRSFSQAIGVNAGGLIVGASFTDDTTDRNPVFHASLWTPATGTPADSQPVPVPAVDLHTLDLRSNPSMDPMSTSVANAVNGSGQVVGSSTIHINGQPFGHAFLWTQADGMTDLLPGSTSSEVKAINDRGWIVGNVDTHAFLWTQVDGIKDLGPLPGGTHSEAVAVNANGQILGNSDLPPTPAGVAQSHAVLWSPQCRELSCRERCDRDDSACQDSCTADFESCPAETPHRDCLKALRACLRDCSKQHAQCLASCR